MNMLIASLIFVILLAVSIAGFSWSLGFTWPMRNAEILARSVSGAPGPPRMPPRSLSFGFALLSLALGLLALSLADHDSGGAWMTTLGTVVGLALLARGAVGFTAWWRERTPEEPFRTLDRKNYSPLSIALGVLFLALVIMRLA